MSGDNLARSAFRLALRGVMVFPLAPGAKVPLAGSHGHLEASSDHDVCRARWGKTRTANIGAATGSRSGFWVLDVDAHHDGEKSLAELEAEHEPLPLTIEASTPRGGRHLHWRWPTSGPEIRNSASRLGPGLDVLAEGGSVMLPPSVLAHGRGYRWAKNGAHAFADAPAWLIALTQPPPPPPRSEPKPPPDGIERYAAAAITSELNRLAGTAEGRRNDQLYRSAAAVAGFVLAGLAPEDWARSELEVRAVQIGLLVHEARATIASAFKAARPRELPR